VAGGKIAVEIGLDFYALAEYVTLAGVFKLLGFACWLDFYWIRSGEKVVGVFEKKTFEVEAFEIVRAFIGWTSIFWKTSKMIESIS
jgi:hypothetical protein